MQVKFLKQIVEHVAGEQATKLVDLLANKKDINEFIIAKKLDLTINQTRNLLYRLSHLGILSSIRKKDKKKGWYIYFWTLNILRSLEILEQKVKKEIHDLEKGLASKKSKRFYKCPSCGRELTEETALLTNFECQECGEIYVLADNRPIIEEIEKKITKLKKELEFIKKEREIEGDKQDKKLQRKIKKIEKEKKEQRAKRRKERERAKKREERKAGKKKSAKKKPAKKKKKSAKKKPKKSTKKKQKKSSKKKPKKKKK